MVRPTTTRRNFANTTRVLSHLDYYSWSYENRFGADLPVATTNHYFFWHGCDALFFEEFKTLAYCFQDCHAY